MPTNDKMIDDPDVKVPKEVQKTIDRANAIFEQMKARQAEGEQPPASPPSAPTLEETLQPEEQPNPEQDPARLLETREQPEPGGEEEPEGEPEEEESWEHKYKSIHGRYKSLQQSTRAMQDQISNMQQVLATLQNPALPEPDQQVILEKLVTPDEENDYGKDLLGVVGKRAREELNPVIAAQAKKIADLERQIQGVNGHLAQNSQERMLSTMDNRLTNWRDINRDSDFLDWLSLPDAYSGAIRHNLLKAAYAAGDASRVLAFFNGFLSEEAATSPAEAEPEIGTRKVPKIPLASLAAPGRAKTAAASGPPAEKPIITRAQIAAFYADAAAGKYRGRDDLRNGLEQQIFAAQREGRIR